MWASAPTKRWRHRLVPQIGFSPAFLIRPSGPPSPPGEGFVVLLPSVGVRWYAVGCGRFLNSPYGVGGGAEFVICNCETCAAGVILCTKFQKLFEILIKKVLDKWGRVWYHNRACVGEFCACTAMMQEIAAKAGNFCGVCPVIGRLNCFCLRCVYRCGRGKVGLASAIFRGLE